MRDKYFRPTMHLDEIGYARTMMKKGWSLQQVAERLGVLSRDLDYWLWYWLGEVPITRPEPLFD